MHGADPHHNERTIGPTSARSAGLATADVRAEIPRNYDVKLMLEMAGELALISYAKRLSLLEGRNGSEFLTADAPVTMKGRGRGGWSSLSTGQSLIRSSAGASPSRCGRATRRIFDDGTWRHREIRLNPDTSNSDCRPIILQDVGKDEVRVVAELVEVLAR